MQNVMRDATMAKPACEQTAREEDPLAVMSEDCLHLNIWTTSRECVSSECANKTVLVFVHDGSFQTGGNRDPLYNGMYLSGLGDVVVVVPNYRLGALGFLNNGSHRSSRQRGPPRPAVGYPVDASNLVLVGYGSGAAAVGYLLASHAVGVREADVVPRRVILMSGSPLTRYPDNTESAKRHVGEQARRMHCLTDGQPDFACMIEANASQFVKTAAPPLFFPSFTGLVKLPPREMLHKDGASITFWADEQFRVDARDA
ncbi:hypothetical protein HPB50_011453 [Hyalomma asiaticum]|uniref:Uncharacterized protein n=1 Tax=Hyalomma asiaticum TaxID=266040 RepID=A0ACB7SPN8_HYAAI|nr:hypothetical protein HPB50_011453 [Hyalomma asiaticum]